MENSIFKANPKLDCYYETSDGVPFYTDYAAKTHAQTLNDKTVTPVHRYAAKSAEPTEPADAPVESDERSGTDSPGEDTPEGDTPEDTEPTEPVDAPLESDERPGTDSPAEDTTEDTEPTEPVDTPLESDERARTEATPEVSEPTQKAKPKTKK